MDRWIEMFLNLGLSHDEAEEIVKIICECSHATTYSQSRLFNAVYDVIEVFKPNDKIGDWLDIFR